MKFGEMTISEIVEWLEQVEGRVTPDDLGKLRSDVRVGVRSLVAKLEKKLDRERQESERLGALWFHEQAVWKQGHQLVAGVDEAGRGPLAGPVVAATVIFGEPIEINGLNDSKLVPPARREELAAAIRELAISWSVSVVDHGFIDDHNILQATKEAMKRSVEGLSPQPNYALVDGNSLPDWKLPSLAVVRGDSLSASIAAASILAKVTRDQIMLQYEMLYPGYGFAQHKGYACPEHFRALRELGPSPIHRRTFLRKFFGEA